MIIICVSETFSLSQEKYEQRERITEHFNVTITCNHKLNSTNQISWKYLSLVAAGKIFMASAVAKDASLLTCT